MCWPGVHQQNCEERSKHRDNNGPTGATGGRRGPPGRPMGANADSGDRGYGRSFDKLQCAIYYAIDGDQVREFHYFLFHSSN